MNGGRAWNCFSFYYRRVLRLSTRMEIFFCSPVSNFTIFLEIFFVLFFFFFLIAITLLSYTKGRTKEKRQSEAMAMGQRQKA